MVRTTPILALLVGLAVLVAGCASGTTSGESETAAEEVRIALVPSEDAERMAEGFEPIRAQLEKDLGRKVELTTVTDYSSVIEAMRADKVDVAWYGPLSLVLAKQQAEAEPFAIAEMEGKGITYRSLVIVAASSSIQTMQDLKGTKIALVDPSSTSGNLIPRSEVMAATGLKAEDFFAQVTYAGSHDAALMALVSGSVDACAVQDVTFEDAISRGDIKREDYRVVNESDEIPQSPMAMRADLDPELKAAIAESFANLAENGVTMDVPGMGKVVRFVPIDYEAYRPIETMAKNLGLSRDEMAR